jgi:hypothetical protein
MVSEYTVPPGTRHLSRVRRERFVEYPTLSRQFYQCRKPFRSYSPVTICHQFAYLLPIDLANIQTQRHPSPRSDISRHKVSFRI